MATADEQRRRQLEMWTDAAPAWERYRDWFERQNQAQGWNEWVCDAIDAQPGMRVLDLACGSGEPAGAIARRVHPHGSVLATDLSPAMVAATERRMRELGLDNVEARTMDIEDLHLPDDSFDAVTCRFGLMFCPDPVRGVAELRRVLRPGGRFAIVVWDEPEKNPFATAIGHVLADFVAMPPPDPTAPGPFRLAPRGELESVLRAGGLEDVRVESLASHVHYESFEEYWEIQTALAAPLRAAIANLPPAELARLEAAVRAGVAPFTDGARLRFDASPLGASGAK